ncbi:MAG: rhodanese-like domain-containing protein [Candidatus Thermoplasmatota archaeon]
MPRVLLSSVLFVGALRRFFGGGAPLENVGAADARRLQLEEGAILVDVRELHEWRGGHAPQAKHIPLGEIEGKMVQLDKGKTIIVTCASGMRSRAGARKLLASGFPRVLNLSGGMNAWRAARLPMQK